MCRNGTAECIEAEHGTLPCQKCIDQAIKEGRLSLLLAKASGKEHG